MARYQYQLILNESAFFAENDLYSADFQFPYPTEGIVTVSSFEEVYQELKRRWNHLSNGEWDWETSYEDSEDGWISFTNDVDGLEVRFKIERLS